MPESDEPVTESVRARKPPLHAGHLLAAAAWVLCRDAWRILAVAITVSTFTVVIEIIEDDLVDPGSLWQLALAGILGEGAGLLGTVFLSGFLCRLTGAAGGDAEPVTIGRVLRSLPWARLIAADLLVVLLTLIGLLALVIPGLIIFNLLTIVGPVIEIEDRTVRGALRRSGQLVRPYFWRVALLASLPVIAVSQLETLGPEPAGAAEIAELLAIRGVGEGFVEAAIGLVLVQLAYRLIALHAAGPRRRASALRRASARLHS